MLLNEQRQTAERVTGAQLALDILIWRTRPAWDIEPWLYDEPLPNRPGAHNEPRRPGGK